MPERKLNAGVSEGETGFQEPLGNDTSAGKKERISQFTKGQTGGELGNWQASWTTNHPPQRFCELPVGDRRRTNPVYGT